MPQLKFTILKEDIMRNNYTHSEGCPITLALRRAGYDMKDGGAWIMNSNRCKVVGLNNEDYSSLMDKLSGMYCQAFPEYHSPENWDKIKSIVQEPQDFEVVINY